MEIQTEWKGRVPVFALKGRLDGFGSQELAEVLGRLIGDDTASVVLDMTGVDYLSSAGIRVILSLKKRMKERDGVLAIAGVQEFPRKVLDMAGFLKVFDLYPSVREALIASARTDTSGGLLVSPGHIETVINGIVYEMEPGSREKATLRITGNLGKVLYSSLTPEDIRVLGFNECEYSLGLGALGKDVGEALPYLGEMITLHGSMVYMPTDGHFTPDFFTPVKDTGDVRIFTGFNIALKGPFHEVIHVETQRQGGVTIAELYRSVFSWAQSRKVSAPAVISIAMWAVADGIKSSEITRAPILRNAPGNGRSIMDPENYAEWNAANTDPRYGGDTLVSFGIGIDRSSDLSGFDPAEISAIVYHHPDNAEDNTVYLHNHGVIFRNVPWNPSAGLSRQIKSIVQDGEFVDMRHLMDDTSIRRAKCGVSYISGISVD
ncbi:MAG: STAS domain-containing protein [Methanoregulaceae archaeon]|nr:STAS domain-containing protein [Methanoregulaceae archaeon]